MKKTTGSVILATLGAVMLLLPLIGCGGGGGSTKSAPQGFVSARVSFEGTKAHNKAVLKGADSAAATATGTVVVNITITGYYSENNTIFPTVAASIEIDPMLGYGRVTLAQVPIGINHLLTAAATFEGEFTETLKAIIPEVLEGQTAEAVVNQASTVVADAAILYAENSGITLAEVPASLISTIEGIVQALHSQGIPYSSMTSEEILKLIQVASVSISPESAIVEVGSTQQFSVTAYNQGGTAVTGVPTTWSVTSTIGTITSDGLFTATAVGSGEVTVSVGGVSATAAVTVTLCTANADCDDNNALTTDICENGGTVNAVCNNIRCYTDAECNDSKELTIDTCTSAGTPSAACTYANRTSCSMNADCNDADAGTFDSCFSDCDTQQTSCSNIALSTISVMGPVKVNSVPVSCAVVRIYNDALTVDEITYTDIDGNYYYENVPSGTYYILATKENATLESTTVVVP